MNNKETILITGGTGLVGKQLQLKLIAKGFNVRILSSNKALCNNLTIFYWDITTNTIDANALKLVDYVIHLAGANIAEKKWTSLQKQLIIDSRTKTTQLIVDSLKANNQSLKAFISSSATGYYGAITSDKIYTETDCSASDFLGTTCQQWENSVGAISALGIRTVILRTGIVLAKNGGAIAKLILPAKLGLSSALGNGNQFFPWIHSDDLCDMYLKAIEDVSMNGVYNAVAPQHVSNKDFTKAFVKSLNKPFFMPNVPAFLLKLILGEMAIMLLTGSRVSCHKIETTGFQFKYKTIDEALKNIVAP